MANGGGWLYENHDREQILQWVGQLDYFYFKRGPGGFGDCGEDFQADIRYGDRADLVAKLRGLGVELEPMRADAPQPEPDTSYTAAEWARFPRALRQFPDLQEPASQLVDGHRVYLSIFDDHFAIVGPTSDHERWAVTEDDFRACLSIERRLDELGWRTWRTFDHVIPSLTVRGPGTYQF